MLRRSKNSPCWSVSHFPGVVVALKRNLALKCDLRDDADVNDKLSKRQLHTVTYDEGLSVARAIGATRYLGECLEW